MVVDVESVAGNQRCGMTTSIARTISAEEFRRLAAMILVPDAIRMLTRLERPLVFEIYCDRDKGLAGWRA